MNKRNYLKMSLKEIRDRLDVNKWTWDNLTSTNCYAYALGLDIPEILICKYAYNPGIIGNSTNQLDIIFSYYNLMENILIDLNALNINYSFILPNDNIDENEWKISLFIPNNHSLDKIDDFHFLRYRNDGCWYHKNGIDGGISNLDYYNQIITNPETCNIKDYVYTNTMKLSLKKASKIPIIK